VIGRAASALLDDELTWRPRLQERLTDRFGERRLIRKLTRRLCPYSSSFRLDELDIQLVGGSRVALVLKDLSREGMIEDARRARPEFLYDPRREINAYRWILPHAPVGTPDWYGAVTDPLRGRYWLFLERVKGPQLTQVGAFSTWERTAAWIARFHGAFSPLRAQQLAERTGALVYDEAFYWRWLRRAQRFAENDPSRRRIVDGIARGYEAVIDRLTTLPRTLIHGELYACNVVVGRGRHHERICPVDWEMAAFGPGLIDLAALSAGWADSKQRALARAYIAARGSGTATRARVRSDFATDLDCCRLHLAVRMLGWSDAWQPPPDHARNWLAEADRISRRLRR
jgi:aminoglycoside phosphotransferase (APT) family kinase protein